MIWFGRHAAEEAEELEKEVDRIKAQNTRKIKSATAKTDNLHRLLKANGITLQVFIATGGDKHHA